MCGVSVGYVMKIVNHEDHKTTHLQEKKSKQINQLQ